MLIMNVQDVFRRMCLIRHFEYQVAAAYEQKRCHAPVYLSVGQEACAATVSTLTEGFTVFAQHRGHDAYLAHGGDPEKLRDELLGLDSGCNRGRGGSACVGDLNIPMYGHHGFIGENVPLATGFAFASKQPTLVYVGDAGVEEDYALAAFGFAATHRVPVLFVCMDNELSILTPTRDRRSWAVDKVVEAMGLATAAIVDEPAEIHATVASLLTQLPALVNIKTCRHLWHAGVGTDGPPAWDRLEELRATVARASAIEDEIKEAVSRLWQEQLQTQ
jgi:pyruvate dehydrogenase E1 component alpha subunit